MKRLIFAFTLVAYLLGSSLHGYEEFVFSNVAGPALQSLFTTTTGSIDYLNRGTAGWSLKPGSITLVLEGGNGATGVLTDDGSNALSGSFEQAPGGQAFSATGRVNYATGAWYIALPVPFLGPAQVSYSFVVRKESGIVAPEYIDYSSTNHILQTIQEIFTTASGSIDYLNRGIVGWSLKSGSITLVLEGGNGATGILTDDGG